MHTLQFGARHSKPIQRLRRRHSARQAGDDGQHPSFRIYRKIEVRGKPETADGTVTMRQHSHNGVGLGVQDQRPAQDIRVAAKLFLPEEVADDDGSLLAGATPTAHGDRHADHVKEIVRDLERGDPACFCPVVPVDRSFFGNPGHVFERPLLLQKIEESNGDVAGPAHTESRQHGGIAG